MRVRVCLFRLRPASTLKLRVPDYDKSQVWVKVLTIWLNPSTLNLKKKFLIRTRYFGFYLFKTFFVFLLFRLLVASPQPFTSLNLTNSSLSNVPSLMFWGSPFSELIILITKGLFFSWLYQPDPLSPTPSPLFPLLPTLKKKCHSFPHSPTSSHTYIKQLFLIFWKLL